MKTSIRIAVMGCIVCWSAGTLAHDPKEHRAKPKTTPDCQKLASTPAGKVDENDPVVKALRMKCKRQREREQAHERQESSPGHDAADYTSSPSAQKPPKEKNP